MFRNGRIGPTLCSAWFNGDPDSRARTLANQTDLWSAMDRCTPAYTVLGLDALTTRKTCGERTAIEVQIHCHRRFAQACQSECCRDCHEFPQDGACHRAHVDPAQGRDN